ncbi:MAG TPA: ROK family protein [Lacipirellulaceae bacterium]|nr:ROK family protein [Lacipirellulaceae bacterium]
MATELKTAPAVPARSDGLETVMKILVIDIGGTNVKLLASGQDNPRKFPSGPELTPGQMVAGVLEATRDWKYDTVAIGYPGPILCGQPMAEPANLGSGWVGFDFEAAFQLPVKIINDAAMQALGSYQAGKMLFVGLGTGFGAAVVKDGTVEALELGRFHYKKGTLEQYVGARGLKRLGRKKWRRHVAEALHRLIEALKPDDLVIGGGNVKKLNTLPLGARAGDKGNAFAGGFCLWEGNANRKGTVATTQPADPANVGGRARRAHVTPPRLIG